MQAIRSVTNQRMSHRSTNGQVIAGWRGAHVGRNAATLVRPPVGHEGRPSKARSVEQAQQLLRAAGERPGCDPACAPCLRGPVADHGQPVSTAVENFADELRAWRERLGWSQAELGAGMGNHEPSASQEGR